jgi:ferredoxin
MPSSAAVCPNPIVHTSGSEGPKLDRLKLLDAGLRAFDARLPDVVPPLCTVTRYRASSCRRCLEVCPGQAITVSPWLRVDPQSCSSCGACSAVCPTGALASGSRAEALRRSFALAAGHGDKDATLACRFVASEALAGEQAVAVLPCLGGLSAADLIAAAAVGVATVTLVCGTCETCSDRSAGALVEAAVEVAQETLAIVGSGLTIVSHETPSCAAVTSATSASLSRRDLFSFMVRGARRTAAEGLGPERRGVADLHAQARPPARHQQLLVDLRKLGAGCREREAAIPSAFRPRALAVGERCNGCGLCARYCPHGALALRDGSLLFDRFLCTGCGLCGEACPSDALTVSPNTTPLELSMFSESASATRLWPAT